MCPCACHKHPEVVHMIPCCFPCKKCGESIPHHEWKQHVVACNNQFVIGVDFDGTCVKHLFPETGTDIPGAAEWLQKFVMAGASLILWTCRGDKYLPPAEQWFHDRYIPLWGVNKNPTQASWSSSPKALCDIYIDDRAIGCPLVPDFTTGRPFVDWSKVGPYVLELMAMRSGR